MTPPPPTMRTLAFLSEREQRRVREPLPERAC
jgi:hypothetical protein